LRLKGLVDRAELLGVGSLDERDLVDLPSLYRHASSLYARYQTRGDDALLLERARAVVSRAHRLLYREPRRSLLAPVQDAVRFLLHASPRAIRGEWRLLLGSFVIFYGLSTVAFLAVRHDLELAFSLYSSELVAQEIEQLRATEQGEPFRGNFTFGTSDSPETAGWILAHNISVSVLFFGAGLIPPLYVWILSQNALMLGVYTGVAHQWGQAGAISSILWTHGVIELQMIVLAGTAGLVLIRAWLAPGPWSRVHAMSLESKRAWALFAPVFPALTLSGFIEGYVSPHAPLAVRLAVAVGTGLLLILWVALGGRQPRGAR
jgi:uncharacterized membrane protein SpoIIM required for sporulation